jgi:putative ABC transport system permease protein
MNIFLAILEQSLTLTPLVFGMYLSYRILRITDLTVDGTYVLGAAIFANTIHLGLMVALLCSIFVGALVGGVVACMQRNNIVNDLIAGVLASFMLYSVNLQVLGRPNVSLLGEPTLLSVFNLEIWSMPFGIVSLLIIISLFFLLTSRFGLHLRAFGHNQKLLGILGKKSENYRLFGLALSNALAAFSGALGAQINGFADINMGFGIALVGIGSVVIGRSLVVKNQEIFSALRELGSCVLGIFLYFSCLSLLLHFGINPVNLKLVLGLVLFLALSKGRVRGRA